MNCQVCNTKMKRSWVVRAGPQGGKRDVYYCPKSGYQKLKPM